MTTVRGLARALHPADHLGFFDPDAIAGYPEPARRWLMHAIEPGEVRWNIEPTFGNYYAIARDSRRKPFAHRERRLECS